MKDPLGHGSNAGLHSGGVQKTPQLQRRHFEAIAAELKAKNASPDEVKAMADKLATTNPGFRRDFFVAAATGGDYRFKGPGKNSASVAKKASKFTVNSAPGDRLPPGYTRANPAVHRAVNRAIASGSPVFTNKPK